LAAVVGVATRQRLVVGLLVGLLVVMSEFQKQQSTGIRETVSTPATTSAAAAVVLVLIMLNSLNNCIEMWQRCLSHLRQQQQ